MGGGEGSARAARRGHARLRAAASRSRAVPVGRGRAAERVEATVTERPRGAERAERRRAGSCPPSGRRPCRRLDRPHCGAPADARPRRSSARFACARPRRVAVLRRAARRRRRRRRRPWRSQGPWRRAIGEAVAPAHGAPSRSRVRPLERSSSTNCAAAIRARRRRAGPRRDLLDREARPRPCPPTTTTEERRKSIGPSRPRRLLKQDSRGSRRSRAERGQARPRRRRQHHGLRARRARGHADARRPSSGASWR